MDTAWHQVISGSFRCTLHRESASQSPEILRLPKTVLSAYATWLLIMRFLCMSGLLRSRITVFQTEFFFGLTVLFDREWRGLRLGENPKSPLTRTSISPVTRFSLTAAERCCPPFRPPQLHTHFLSFAAFSNPSSSDAAVLKH